jgi:hypothetical protein
VSDDQQSEFKSLSEFYIIIFLNKLKIVENIPPPPKFKKKKKEGLRLRLCGLSFRDSHATSWLSGTRTDVPDDPPSPLS